LTKKPTKRLSDEALVYFCLLLFPLAGFFVFALFNPYFFVWLVVAFVGLLVVLLPLKRRYRLKQAETALQIQSYQERQNLLEIEITREEKAIVSFQEKIVNAHCLKGMMEKLSLCLYTEDTSKTLSAEVGRLFGGEDTTIILYLFQSKTGELGISSSRKGQMRVSIKSKKGDVFDQWVVRTMQPLLVEDTRSDYRFDIDKARVDESRVIRSLMSAPLMVGNKALGILRVESAREKSFTTEDLRFLTTIGDLGSVAIENAQLYERVEQLAIRDGLTGVYLRRYLQERFPQEISRHLRNKSPLALLMIDLDYFKRYNDRFGHVAGDLVLKRLGKILKGFFQSPGDLVCRYGGEEFCVLLPDCPRERALALAERLRQKVAAQTILLRREKNRITVSIGVAVFPEDAGNKDELVHKADMALYRAKQQGRNRVEAVG